LNAVNSSSRCGPGKRCESRSIGHGRSFWSNATTLGGRLKWTE
jgi:hypothetical protein